MTTVAEAFAHALQLHRTGNWPQAEHAYLQIVDADPNHADALHSLGVLAYQTGRLDQAIEYVHRALSLNPQAADYYSNLGLIYQAYNRLDESVASFRKALVLQPHFAEAHNNLGLVLHVLGRAAEAAECFQQAVFLKADYAEAHNNLGVALQSQGKLAAACECYRHALFLRPDYAEARKNLDVAAQEQQRHDDEWERYVEGLRFQTNSAEAQYNLGVALRERGNFDESISSYRRALELKPDFVAAHYNLGVAYHELGKLGEAAACYGRALQLRPEYAEAHNNLGAVWQRQGKLDQAIDCYQEALRLQPEYLTALNNWGVTLYEQGKPGEALAAYERALRLRPDDPEVRLNRALILLQQGDFANGWREYEWRWQSASSVKRQLRQPLWDGSPLGGRTILLHAEQGLGDTIQFVRYAPLVQQLGGRVIVECPPALLEILKSCRGIDYLVAQGSVPPAFDFHAPLLSLPRICATTPDTIPDAVPYLAAHPQRLAHWQERLAKYSAFRIGLGWQGNPKAPRDWSRSIPLEAFLPLAGLPNVQLVSLQKGPGTEQIPALEGKLAMVGWTEELDEAAGPFMDTAALMKCLDLVITSDSALAHLAGALGVPVWVALSIAPDWRWLLHREDSPWYPTMRLFRQQTAGDWNGVIARMVQALS